MKRLSIKLEKKYVTYTPRRSYVARISTRDTGGSCNNCAFKRAPDDCQTKYPCVLEKNNGPDDYFDIHWIRVR